MNRLLDDFQRGEDAAGGEGLPSMTEEGERKAHGTRNGEHEDLRIMQHFVEGHVPGPTLLVWKMKTSE